MSNFKKKKKREPMIQVSSSYAFHGKASEDLKDRRKRVKQGSRAAHILTEEKKKRRKRLEY